ncbi:MAG: CDP-diacylglycerol--glycerol-3-phosphate 3-phosphatidyltransferase [Deltaproteobacteria bacterium RIFOXYD12_FULL_50_9]|nr:MAG: CDP-diacylglycerol--glycerol-3-phosphate 3-phosphatidyltransferase [Deltaproteobacteria bacterium RIFOXYD12_FULL_50_9]
MSAHQIVTLPNLLTGYRFAVVPILLFCLYPEANTTVSLTAFALFLSAAFTDLADGYYARKQQSESVLGKLIDPLADKVLVASALIMLIPIGRVPAYVSFLILARELVITGLRGVAASAGIVIAASSLGKIKSVAQYTAICVLIFPLGVLPIPYLHEMGLAILYFSLILTIWSGFNYFHNFQKVFLTTANMK